MALRGSLNVRGLAPFKRCGANGVTLVETDPVVWHKASLVALCLMSLPSAMKKGRYPGRMVLLAVRVASLFLGEESCIFPFQ